MASRRRALARRRTRAGLTQEALAEVLEVDRSTVGRWEAGLTTPSPEQRPALGRALNVSEDGLQELLEEHEAPTRRSALARSGALAAGALVSPVLGVQDLQRILAALEESHRLDATTVAGFEHSIGQCAADDGLYGPATALSSLLPVLAAVQASVAKADSAQRRSLLQVGARGFELAAWLYRDLGIGTVADHWRDQALAWARQAADPTLETYVLLKKAQAAWDRRDGRTMTVLAAAVLELRCDLPAPVRAEALQQQARGLAMTGQNRGSVARSLEHASQSLSQGTQSTLSPHYGKALFAVQSALSYTESGRAARAVEMYREHLSPELFSTRDYAYFRALESQALAQAGHPEEACERALESVETARGLGSGRTLNELARLPRLLEPWRSRSVVRDTVDALTRDGRA